MKNPELAKPFAILATAATLAGGYIVAKEIDKPDKIGCDATLSSPVSWLVCPIADIGSDGNNILEEQIHQTQRTDDLIQP